MVDPNAVLLDVVIVTYFSVILFTCYEKFQVRMSGFQGVSYLPVNDHNGKSIFPCQSYAQIMFI